MSSTAAAPRQRGIHIDPTASVHPTAVLEGDVEVGPGTVIGPGAVVLGTVGPVRIGANCTLVARAFVNGPATLGDRNVVYPNACLGFAPQDLGFDHNAPGPGLEIGNGNTFREGVTVHRGKTSEPTRIGDSNYWMTNSHLGHDAQVGNHCVIASGALLGGHVQLADRVTIGGNAAVHQFVRIGRGALLSGTVGTALDLPPWFTLTARSVAGSMNVVGLRRSGATQDTIHTVRWIYQQLYRTGGTPQQGLRAMRTRAGHPVVDEYIAFIEQSKRGICHGPHRTTRGMTGHAAD
jgi:UDP-N-acetylglucosamine acyltransferase